MNILHAIISRPGDNYCAFITEDVGAIGGVGNTIAEVKKSLYEGLDIMLEEYRNHPDWEMPELLKGDIEIVFQMDVISFLEYYAGILSKSGLEKITGINQKQLGHYASGLSKPRAKQRARIEAGLHRLGEELLSIRFDSDSN